MQLCVCVCVRILFCFKSSPLLFCDLFQNCVYINIYVYKLVALKSTRFWYSANNANRNIISTVAAIRWWGGGRHALRIGAGIHRIHRIGEFGRRCEHNILSIVVAIFVAVRWWWRRRLCCSIIAPAAHQRPLLIDRCDFAIECRTFVHWPLIRFIGIGFNRWRQLYQWYGIFRIQRTIHGNGGGLFAR